MSQRARRGLIIIGILLLPFILGLFITFEVIKIDVPTDMADQISINYQEAPRLTPAQFAVSNLGQSLVLDAIPVNPVSADDVSLLRGAQLYEVTCSLCHGESGLGDGPMVEYFQDAPPPDITGSNIGRQLDGAIYRTISVGFGGMYPLGENLLPRERWDVINYLRTLEVDE